MQAVICARCIWFYMWTLCENWKLHISVESWKCHYWHFYICVLFLHITPSQFMNGCLPNFENKFEQRLWDFLIDKSKKDGNINTPNLDFILFRGISVELDPNNLGYFSLIHENWEFFLINIKSFYKSDFLELEWNFGDKIYCVHF